MKKSEKQKWMELNQEQRKQYFLDYYLFPVSVIIIILAIVCFLGWHFFLKPDEENLLYAAVVDDSLDQEKQEQAVLDMQDILGADGKYKQIHIDDSFYLKDGALDKIQVYLHSQQIDVLILDQDVFEEFAGYGYFRSLDELTGEDLAEKYDTDYVYAAGYRDTDEISFEDHETGQGATEAYGLSLEGKNRFTDMTGGYLEHPVFAVAVDAPNPENALKFLDYLMNGEGGEE
ncbi:hypothetical protein [Blautia sp. MSJ-19]|uniref:hypothetical protein n=1 Tax=Blautia sp. MSJ-19 TaxID=2841517 RepID=UPI001C0EC826|nr:hypothetical protein [Blautia sp. MSJ-19]